MSTHSLTTALTLYRSGTLSLAQAARQAGCTEHEFAAVLGKHGITVRELGRSPTEPASDSQARVI